jgi:ribosome-binding factor A
MSFSISKNLLQRTAADIQRVLTVAVLQKISNENIASAAIVRVELSADFATCRVYVNGAVKDFESATNFLRNEIAQNVKMRRIPALRFILDDGEKNAKRVEELLQQINSGKRGVE